MDVPSPTRTSATLLGRLRHEPGEGAGWDEFARKYAPLILGWCRRWKLQEADAQDVAQDVLARLADRLRTFEYDRSKSFRGYVKTMAHYALCDFTAARKRPGAGGSGDSIVLDVLANVAARDDLQSNLADAFDLELLEAATASVRLRVEPHTYEAFRLTAVEGLSGAEAAERLGVKASYVFKAKSRVQQMLRDEVGRLKKKW